MKNTPIIDENSRYAVTAAEMKRCDTATIEHFGIPQDVLMERAALAICKYTKRHVERGQKIVILAGSGNNGGDGIAAGRILHQDGFQVTIILVNHSIKNKNSGSGRSSACEAQLKIALSYGVNVVDFTSVDLGSIMRSCDVVIDAMLGIGCSRDLSGDYLKATEAVNYAREDSDDGKPVVIAADIPTGISSDTGKVCGHAIRADETVTFGFLKLGCIFYPGAAHAGTIHIVNVGITEDGFLNDYPRFKYIDVPDCSKIAQKILPKRNPAGNKGSFGKVMIAAGSRKMSGACIMAAESCLRSGVGMVRILTEKANHSAIQMLLPEAMTDIYDEDEIVENPDAIEKLMDNALMWADAVVCGPGLGTGESGIFIVRKILSEGERPLVLDADALNIIAADSDIRQMAVNYKGDIIMTPHLAEFSRLAGKNLQECRENIATETAGLAKEFHASIICKDARSIISGADGNRNYINLSGNDGMATAGSGDILAGLLGALVVYGFDDAFDAAVTGCFLHGAAGDMAAEKNGRQGMTARDISAGLRDIFSGKSQ